MEEERNVFLKWNGHQDTLLSVFVSLFHNRSLVDCTLSAEGRHFKAHKVILSACSPYFEMLFSQYYETDPIVILPDVEFQILMVVMEFIYSGEVSVPQDIVGEVLNLAENLQIKGLYGTHYTPSGEHKSKKRKITIIPTEQPVEHQTLVSDTQNSKEGINICNQTMDTLSVSLQNDVDNSVPARNVKCEEETSLVCKEILANKQTVYNKRESRETCKLEVLSAPLPPEAEVYCNTNSNVNKRSQFFVNTDENSSSEFLTGSCSKRHCNDKIDTSAYEETKSQESKLAELSIVKHELDVDNFNDESVEVITIDDESDYQSIDHCGDGGSVSTINRMVTDFVEDSNLDSHQLGSFITFLSEPASELVCPFKCNACGKSYRQNHNLMRHVKYECGKEPFFKCLICPARYTRNEKLKAHILTVHCST